MAKKVVTQFDEAKIDSEVFSAYTKEILGHMREAYELKEKAKEVDVHAKDAIKTYAETAGIKTKELTAYMKARFEESLPKEAEDAVGTKIVIERAVLYTILNEHLEL